MRGVRRNVIEINDTDSGDIEKILVFLKSGRRDISVDNARRDAVRILDRVKVRKGPGAKSLKRSLAAAAVLAAVLLARRIFLL